MAFDLLVGLILANKFMVILLRALQLHHFFQLFLDPCLRLLLSQHHGVFFAKIELTDTLSLLRFVLPPRLHLFDQARYKEASPEAATILILHLNLSSQKLIIILPFRE